MNLNLFTIRTWAYSKSLDGLTENPHMGSEKRKENWGLETNKPKQTHEQVC